MDKITAYTAVLTGVGIWSYLLILALIGYASAFEIQYLITDLNTRQPIENASIRIYNDTFLASNTTDALGLSLLYSDMPLQFETIRRTGYLSQNNSVSDAVDGQHLIYMIPISSTGLIRVRFRDFMGGERGYCVFYVENNRMLGCFGLNDTINLLVNKEYIIVPEIKLSDSITDLEGMEKTSGMLGKAVWPTALMLCLIGAFIAVVWRKK
jgi:uncharacterized membrane protein YagU involved in acid resistance